MGPISHFHSLKPYLISLPIPISMLEAIEQKQKISKLNKYLHEAVPNITRSFLLWTSLTMAMSVMAARLCWG